MSGLQIFKKASSLSAAVSFLLSGQHASASPSTQSLPKVEDPKDQPFEPFVYQPGQPRVMDDAQFAGHASHASHSSH
jgi:hypothetical protein